MNYQFLDLFFKEIEVSRISVHRSKTIANSYFRSQHIYQNNI